MSFSVSTRRRRVTYGSSDLAIFIKAAGAAHTVDHLAQAAATPHLATKAAEAHAALTALVNSLEAQVDFVPSDAKQKTIDDATKSKKPQSAAEVAQWAADQAKQKAQEPPADAGEGQEAQPAAKSLLPEEGQAADDGKGAKARRKDNTSHATKGEG